MGRVTTAKCRGGLKHGVPYEAMDLLGLIPHHTDYSMKLGPNLEEFTVHFQCLWIGRGVLA